MLYLFGVLWELYITKQIIVKIYATIVMTLCDPILARTDTDSYVDLTLVTIEALTDFW